MDINKTYVYEGTEVKWTGKSAVKKTPSGKPVMTIYEITPTDNSFDPWKKWVAEQQLYVVET